MTRRAEHHFVSQFYLRVFGSSERATNLFNLSRGVAIPDVSIRDQCRRHRFYGNTDVLDGHLMNLENATAPVLRGIRDSRRVPPKGSPGRERLIGFVALQLLRTTAAANRANESMDKLFKQAFRRDPRFREASEDFEKTRFWSRSVSLTS